MSFGTARVERIIRNAGARRLTSDAAEYLNTLLVEYGTQVARCAVLIALNGGRKAVTSQDIIKSAGMSPSKREQLQLTHLNTAAQACHILGFELSQINIFSDRTDKNQKRRYNRNPIKQKQYSRARGLGLIDSDIKL